MIRGVAWGSGKGLDGREAARQAAQQAIERLGGARLAAAIVFAAQEYALNEVASGVASLLGGIPVWGMGTTRPLHSAGEAVRSVVVAILAGNDAHCQTIWQPQFGRDSAAAGREMAQALAGEEWRGFLLAADGIQGEFSLSCPALTSMNGPVAGGLAAGDIQQGKTFQLADQHSGSGALTGLALGGKLRLGVGQGHGWKDTGIYFSVTRARSIWLQGLDGVAPAEAYARVFGASARQWAFPPLTQLARLYPLGIETSPGRPELILRSPLQVGVDGGFRLNTAIAEGEVAHLMIGDISACLEAARAAVRQAQERLNGARPMLAIAFIDQAWQYLFESQPGRLVNTLTEELGKIPLVGAYTLGQICRPEREGLVRFYNQQIQIGLIGEE